MVCEPCAIPYGGANIGRLAARDGWLAVIAAEAAADDLEVEVEGDGDVPCGGGS